MRSPFYISLMVVLVGCSSPKTKTFVVHQDKKEGVVNRFLVDPHGLVNGLLLVDGTQVNFPPALGLPLISTIGPRDRVLLVGFRENKMLFEAETITNAKTHDVVAMADPIPPDPTPLDPAGLKKLKSHGTVQVRLMGRRGEINGVILKNGSIVMFGPHLPSKLNVRTEVGERIRASGYGTVSEHGQSIEAVEMSNF